MGNTRHIWFEGNAFAESKNELTREAILDSCHGTYAAIEIDEQGYLGSNERDKGETDLFIVGIVHTYSMRGPALADYLKTRLRDGTIGILDHDYPELTILKIENKELILIDRRMPGRPDLKLCANCGSLSKEKDSSKPEE